MGSLCRHNSISRLDRHTSSLKLLLSARPTPTERVLCAGQWPGLHAGARRGRGVCLPLGSRWGEQGDTERQRHGAAQRRRVAPGGGSCLGMRGCTREAAPPKSRSGAPRRLWAPGREKRAPPRAPTGQAAWELEEATRRGKRHVEPHLVTAPAVSLWVHFFPLFYAVFLV